MATYFSLRNGLISDATNYGLSIDSMERITNTTGYMLLTSDNWSTTLTGFGGDIIDSIAVNVSSRAAIPTGTLTLQVSSRTVSPTTLGIYPISSFTSYEGFNNLVSYPLNWQLLKLSSPFSNNTESFKINLKTSNSNQLSLLALSTVNGINYNRMAILSSAYNSGNGPLSSGAASSTSSPFGTGIDGSVNFDGNVEVSTLDTSTDFSFRNNYTVEGWFFFPNTTNDAVLVGQTYRTNFDNYWNIMHRTGGAPGLTFYIVTSGTGRVNFNFSRNTRLTTNTWHHIAVTSDGTTIRGFVNGVLSGSNAAFNNYNLYGKIKIGAMDYGAGPFRFIGNASNVRIIKDSCLYTSNFTPPTAPLEPILGTIFLYNSPYSTSFYEKYPTLMSPTTLDTTHIGGNLSGFNVDTRTITSSNYNIGNLYIHKNGVLSFPSTSTSLTAVGTNGIQITSEGTLEIGTSSNSIPLSTTHRLVLSSNQIGISNGGILNTYGSYKVPYTSLISSALTNTRIFPVSDNISNNWAVNDTLIFTPNTAQYTSYDQLILSSFDNNSTFRTTASNSFEHSVLNYIPNVANITRNIKIGGASNSAKGYIIAKDNATVNINNTEFTFISSGLYSDISDNGLFLLSGCTLSGDGNQSIINSTINRYKNVNLFNNIILKGRYGLEFNSVSSNNSNFSNNLLLSSISANIFFKNLSGDVLLNNNISIGPSPYGTFLINNNNNIPSNIINYNNTFGTCVSTNHVGLINNFTNTYNIRAGIYVDGTVSTLSSTTFSNITASNNKSLGFVVSGNSINHLNPVILNINGLIANSNLSGGFEGYCIAGNLSSILLSANGGNYQIKTSIGNYYTTFDGITALTNNVSNTSAAIGILSGINYYPTVIKNSNIGKAVGSSTFGAGIILDSTKFSQFNVYNSTVSGGSSDFQLRTTRNILEGSYLIGNTNVGTLPVGVGISNSNYQSDVLKTTGFAFTNMNNASGYNVTYLAAGTRQIDSTTTCNINESTSPSERLTPQSTTIKLRSGSKFVALNSGESTAINVYVRKSTVATNGVAYNGNSPRLILKRNGAAGINQDILMDQLDTTSENFLKLGGVSPAVTDSCVLEFYVDCDGTQGWINIDNWTAN